ncbi:sn-glycerol-3-phosphate ABC transporter ATP-binding protein UgpC [Aliiroseovarius subalbicans]|uniref:ABC transporter ATP-binding protein n=1 Tax=Aliiroseovarius subalbicans TaxID=2925840 RepID=UPI001F5AB391|nr:sn-glycerol-3-phosphate ABC transporter ATP-binding protein UgpC [Aliiroseovarius subalbicans]MCI2400345.1 sn-glycerol-3-phosphate ABC transporter ATP-binding protein UgpC [Aliiroseovarius subalbicans]
MSGVTLNQAIKRYGDVQVIHGVDLEIEDGEFCVFVGPSGCGKSTLLRMIAGLEETTAGKIAIGGRDVTDVDPADRGVAMVFQTYALYPHMTVEENMGFGLKMNGMPKAEVAEKVGKAAEILQLGDYMKRKPKALSGGQRQRVAIGRAITRGPDVFLFDEPLSNLDAELRVDMRVEISRLHNEIGATMIYVTHDQVEAMTLADKIVVLRAGHIEQVGSPMDLYQDPDNKFVAGFIGSPSMNFMQGVVEGGKVRLPALGDALVQAQVALPGDGAAVTVGLRPQNLKLVADDASPIVVDISERLGGVAYDYLDTPTGERIVVETKGDDVQPAGANVTLDFDPATAMFFDTTTEARLR